MSHIWVGVLGETVRSTSLPVWLVTFLLTVAAFVAVLHQGTQMRLWYSNVHVCASLVWTAKDANPKKIEVIVFGPGPVPGCTYGFGSRPSPRPYHAITEWIGQFVYHIYTYPCRHRCSVALPSAAVVGIVVVSACGVVVAAAGAAAASSAACHWSFGCAWQQSCQVPFAAARPWPLPLAAVPCSAGTQPPARSCAGFDPCAAWAAAPAAGGPANSQPPNCPGWPMCLAGPGLVQHVVGEVCSKGLFLESVFFITSSIYVYIWGTGLPHDSAKHALSSLFYEWALRGTHEWGWLGLIHTNVGLKSSW